MTKIIFFLFGLFACTSCGQATTLRNSTAEQLLNKEEWICRSAEIKNENWSCQPTEDTIE